MLRYLIGILIITFSTIQAVAADFYIDPVNGSMENDGSEASPWSSLQDVVDNKVQSQMYAVAPYDPLNPALVPVNAAAPVSPGDTIYLMSGYHGSVMIWGRINSTEVTIKAAPGQTPQLSKLMVRSGKNWVFDGLTISPSYSPITLPVGQIFRVESHAQSGPSSHITIKNSSLFSASSISGWDKDDWVANGHGGISIVLSDYCTISGVTLQNVMGGISIDRSNHTTIISSMINHTGADGINLVGADYAKVEYNTIKNVYAILAPDIHYDMIQAWAVGSPMVGAEVRGNVLLLSEDINQPYRETVQGIGMFDGWYEDFIIENNLVITDSNHGITLIGANNCKVVNNTVVSAFDDITPKGAPIRVYPLTESDPGVDNAVRNNFSSYISLRAGQEGIYSGTVTSNNITAFTDSDHFINPFTYNYNLKPTSIAIGAGTATDAPEYDITLYPRRGTYDIGAFQYRTPRLFRNVRVGEVDP